MAMPHYYRPYEEEANVHRQPFFLYEERAATLTDSGITYALSFVFVAQFIYLNFGFLIGAIITTIWVANLMAQLILSPLETYYLDNSLYKSLHNTLRAHYWINHGCILITIPFLIWTIALMYVDRGASSPI